MNLYAIVDKKSDCAEYILARCDEDALRNFAVLMMAARPVYEFAEDFALHLIRRLPDSGINSEEVVLDGFEVKRQIDARRKEKENAKA